MEKNKKEEYEKNKKEEYEKNKKKERRPKKTPLKKEGSRGQKKIVDPQVVGKKTKKRKRKKLTAEEISLRNKKRRIKNVKEIISFFVPIIIMAILVFLFILNTSPHMVDGDSMNPTLKNGDRVIVRRTKKVRRYEIITFKPPVESKFQYVKRVIGMPGDVVWVEGEYLFINQQTTELPNKVILVDDLPNGTLKVNISKTCAEKMADLKNIPEGNYFVLGDNRENSSDSREFGLVSSSSIEGVVSFRFAPFNQITWVK